MQQVSSFNYKNVGHSRNLLQRHTVQQLGWPDSNTFDVMSLDHRQQQQLNLCIEEQLKSISRRRSILLVIVCVLLIIDSVISSSSSSCLQTCLLHCTTPTYTEAVYRAVADNVSVLGFFVCCAVVVVFSWLIRISLLSCWRWAHSTESITIDLSTTTSKHSLPHQTTRRPIPYYFFSSFSMCVSWLYESKAKPVYHDHVSPPYFISDYSFFCQWIPTALRTHLDYFIRRISTSYTSFLLLLLLTAICVLGNVLRRLAKNHESALMLNGLKKATLWPSLTIQFANLIQVLDEWKKSFRPSHNASSWSSSCMPTILFILLIQSRLIIPTAGFVNVASGGHLQPLTADSLNPWLSADGGLILRAVSPGNNNNNNINPLSLNWVRSNTGSCVPQPTTPACPSDRYCRLPEIANGNLAAGSRSSFAFFDRNIRPLTTTTSSSSSSKSEDEQRGDVVRQMIIPSDSTAVANASQCLPYLRPTNKIRNNKNSSNGASNNNSSIPSPAECICGHTDGAKRIDALRKYHLHHCYHYKLWYILSDTMLEGIARSRSQCYAYLEIVEQLDNLAAHFVCQFEDIIRRYDCAQTFSSKSSCHQCKVSTIFILKYQLLFV